MIRIFAALLIALHSTNIWAQKNCNGNNVPNFSILIDLSQPLDQPNKISFDTLARRIIEVLPSGARFSVYTIKPNSEDIQKKVDYETCVPDFDAMKGETFKSRAKSKFIQSVLPELEKLGRSYVPARKSPILENIFKISHYNFLSNITNSNQTLIVISDLIQFSDLADFYSQVPEYKNFSSKGMVSSWLPRVNSVKLHLVLLRNSDSIRVDLKKLRSFWLDYAKENFKYCGFSGINEISVSFKNDC